MNININAVLQKKPFVSALKWGNVQCVENRCEIYIFTALIK